eukprot:g4648.t1
MTKSSTLLVAFDGVGDFEVGEKISGDVSASRGELLKLSHDEKFLKLIVKFESGNFVSGETIMGWISGAMRTIISVNENMEEKQKTTMPSGDISDNLESFEGKNEEEKGNAWETTEVKNEEKKEKYSNTVSSGKSDGAWEKAVCPTTGREYWYNAETDESVWSDPTLKEQTVINNVKDDKEEKKGNAWETRVFRRALRRKKRLMFHAATSVQRVYRGHKARQITPVNERNLEDDQRKLRFMSEERKVNEVLRHLSWAKKGGESKDTQPESAAHAAAFVALHKIGDDIDSDLHAAALQAVHTHFYKDANKAKARVVHHHRLLETCKELVKNQSLRIKLANMNRSAHKEAMTSIFVNLPDHVEDRVKVVGKLVKRHHEIPSTVTWQDAYDDSVAAVKEFIDPNEETSFKRAMHGLDHAIDTARNHSKSSSSLIFNDINIAALKKQHQDILKTVLAELMKKSHDIQQKRNSGKMRGEGLKIKMLMRGNSFFSQMKIRQNSSIKVQCAFRGYTGRKRFQAQRNACIKIQSSARTWTAVKRYQEMKEGCIKIQSIARMKAVLTKFCTKKKTGFKIQSAVKSAILIEKYFRCFAEYSNFHNQKRACICIQAFARGYSASSKLKVKRESATKVQGFYRGWIGQKHFQQKKDAATSIEAFARCLITFQKFKLKKKSCIQIQSQGRRFIVENQLNGEIEEASAVQIQSKVRESIAKENFTKKKVAIIKVQALVRGFVAKAKFQREKKAALKMVSCERAVIGKLRFQEKMQAIKTIQKIYRGENARYHLRTKRKAATQIQKVARGYQTRCKYKDSIHLKGSKKKKDEEKPSKLDITIREEKIKRRVSSKFKDARLHSGSRLRKLYFKKDKFTKMKEEMELLRKKNEEEILRVRDDARKANEDLKRKLENDFEKYKNKQKTELEEAEEAQKKKLSEAKTNFEKQAVASEQRHQEMIESMKETHNKDERKNNENVERLAQELKKVQALLLGKEQEAKKSKEVYDNDIKAKAANFEEYKHIHTTELREVQKAKLNAELRLTEASKLAAIKLQNEHDAMKLLNQTSEEKVIQLKHDATIASEDYQQALQKERNKAAKQLTEASSRIEVELQQKNNMIQERNSKIAELQNNVKNIEAKYNADEEKLVKAE